MEAEDVEPTSSQVPVVAAPISHFSTGDDETMEKEGPENKIHRIMAGLSMCSFLLLVDEILVGYVATHELDERLVHDHKTGERVAPHVVKIGRRTECEAMVRHQLFERVLIPLARERRRLDANGWKR